MTIYFVSRHTGAFEWAAERNLRIDRQVEHLDLDTIAEGDVVIGSLPVHMAGVVCQKGGRYFHLTLEVPLALRGKELTALQMDECGASLQEFVVVPVAPVQDGKL